MPAARPARPLPTTAGTASGGVCDHGPRDRRPGCPRVRSASAGSRPRRRATSLVGRRWICSPSRITCPVVGRSSRARARSSVDLPQALGPTITVTLPSGTDSDEPVDDRVVVVRETDVFGPRRAIAARPAGRRTGAHNAPVRAWRVSSQSRYGAPITAVMIPTGKLGRRHDPPCGEVGDHDDECADERGRDDARPG